MIVLLLCLCEGGVEPQSFPDAPVLEQLHLNLTERYPTPPELDSCLETVKLPQLPLLQTWSNDILEGRR